MIKKKVLVYGSLDSLIIFLESPFKLEYEILALIAEDFDEIDSKSLNVGFELVSLRNVNQFAYKIIDGLVIVNDKNRRVSTNYFISQGVEPRKIILWNNQGIPEYFTIKESNGSDVIFMEGLQFHIRKQSDLEFAKQIRWQLLFQKQFYVTNPSQYEERLKSSYKRIKNINFNNPETFTEKIQWLKLYDSTPVKTRLADKYLVRQWVAEKIGDKYLIPLLGVWDKFDDIDFDALPNQFVLKCNHGSGMNIICRDKESFDRENAREKINAWMSLDYGALTYELHYNAIKKKIIAEKFLTNEKSSDANDYKLWCFDGHVEYVQVDRNRSTNHVQRFYSVDWEPLSFKIASHTMDAEILERPSTLEEMLNIARTLSAGFNIVRVDLYCVKDKIYFGEMTFTPLNGSVTWDPPYIDYHIGSLIKI